jgi:hypothetical protein
MKITVLAEHFEDGQWKDLEHVCNQEEVEAVADSAMAKASDRMHFGKPSYIDYLAGAAYVFNVAYGDIDTPRDGDLRVYAAIVDEMLIGISNNIEHHFRTKLGAA